MRRLINREMVGVNRMLLDMMNGSSMLWYAGHDDM